MQTSTMLKEKLPFVQLLLPPSETLHNQLDIRMFGNNSH